MLAQVLAVRYAARHVSSLCCHAAPRDSLEFVVGVSAVTVDKSNTRTVRVGDGVACVLLPACCNAG